MAEPDVVLRGRFGAEHQKRYAHVPFDVPPGVRALHVVYEYTDRISSDPASPAATPSTLACSTRAESPRRARASVAGAGRTSAPFP